ncbi:MAG: DUF3078 domain-containing protein [Muribaculaceae bacterium]|nr:DUF3078 domain-containing protein [Muribaculaceae bacterium]
MHIKSYCLTILASSLMMLPGRAQGNLMLPEEGDSLRQIDLIEIIEPNQLFESIEVKPLNARVLDRGLLPMVFNGYRHIHMNPDFKKLKPYNGLKVMTSDTIPAEDEEFINVLDSIEGKKDLTYLFAERESVIEPAVEVETIFLQPGENPVWLKEALMRQRLQSDLHYLYMIDNPTVIEYAYWDLPEPPELYEDDVTFLAFIKKQDVPEVNPDDAVIPDVEIKKKFWLHTFGTQLQFSQAFVSPNWYQGGNNYLSLLFNFNWNVQLNQVFHPNILFQSNLQYKLAISSTPKGNIHKYQISEDIFQYNLNTGLKAFGNWFYSFNMMFKTQLFNNYADNSMERKASILSPGELNLGLGMSYNHKNKLNTFKYTLTVSPLSYNLKTCISDKINHELYSIKQDRKTKSEIGSNIEYTMDWKMTANIGYSTRVFMFTDYSYFLADWQNTFSFEINKFLSTQLYLHLRWDTSSERNGSWKTFMMREILSFGLSYTFSTKP